MTEYEKLRNIVDEADSLLKIQVKWSSPEVQSWHNKASRWLLKNYGLASYEYTNFRRISYETVSLDEVKSFDACAKGLQQAKAILTNYFEDFEESTGNDEMAKETKREINYTRVFIVHGHDGQLRESVARIIEKQGIEAVILSEQANQGKTIIEKFENYSDVGGAICLFTADDVGRSKVADNDRARARQNVVFETGYFIGKLNRNHIVILADDGIEMPSDLSGVVRTNTDNWKVDLLKELRAMGYSIDFNKLF